MGKKLNNLQIQQLRTLAKTMNYRDISKITGVPKSTVARACKGLRKWSPPVLRGKRHPKYKTGHWVRDSKTGKQDVTKMREGARIYERTKLGTSSRYPSASEKDLIKKTGKRTREPIEVTETVLRKKIQGRCQACGRLFYSYPSRPTRFCSFSCSAKLRKRDRKGHFV